MPFFRKELAYSLVVALGPFTSGVIMSFCSPALKALEHDLDISPTAGTWFNALAPIFAVFGGPISNLVIAKHGRRIPTFAFALLAFIGWATLYFTTASSRYLAFVGRAMLGVSLGASSGLCSMYITELAPMEYRGAYGSISQLSVTIGVIYGYGLGLVLTWKNLAAVGMLPPLLLMLFIPCIPESPAVGRIMEQKDTESYFQAKFFGVFLISLGLMFFQQFSGINAISANMQQIFSDCKVGWDPGLCSLIVGISQMLATAVSMSIIECLGRKKAWIVSSVGQFLSLVAIALNAHFNWNPFIPLAGFFLFIAFFGLGFGPIPWFLIPELHPDSVRSMAQTTSTGFNWLSASAVILTWPTMKNGMGLSLAFGVYAIVCFLGIVFGVVFIPETKGIKMGAALEYTQIDDAPLYDSAVPK